MTQWFQKVKGGGGGGGVVVGAEGCSQCAEVRRWKNDITFFAHL